MTLLDDFDWHDLSCRYRKFFELWDENVEQRLASLEESQGQLTLELVEQEAPFFFKFEARPHRGGWGLFASEDIHAGEIVSFVPLFYVVNGTRIVFEHDDSPQVLEFYRYQEGIVHIIKGRDVGQFSLTTLMNHACYPSCNTYCDEVVENFDTGDQGTCTIALRDIKKGEQLTTDYASYDYTLRRQFECRCDSAQCRGRIVGFKHLPPEIQWQLLDSGMTMLEITAELYSDGTIAERAKIRHHIGGLSEKQRAIFCYYLDRGA